MDRFVRGFIIGATAGLIKAILAYTIYILTGIGKYRFADLMAVLITGRPTDTLLNYMFFQILENSFAGLLGIGFITYAYRTQEKKNLWFKAMLMAIIVFISVHTIGKMYQLPLITSVEFPTAVVQFFNSCVWGVLTGLGVYYWGLRLGDFEDDRST